MTSVNPSHVRERFVRTPLLDSAMHRGSMLPCRMRVSTMRDRRPQRKGLQSRRLAFRTRWWTARTGEKPSCPLATQRFLRCGGWVVDPSRV